MKRRGVKLRRSRIRHGIEREARRVSFASGSGCLAFAMELSGFMLYGLSRFRRNSLCEGISFLWPESKASSANNSRGQELTPNGPRDNIRKRNPNSHSTKRFNENLIVPAPFNFQLSNSFSQTPPTNLAQQLYTHYASTPMPMRHLQRLCPQNDSMP